MEYAILFSGMGVTILFLLYKNIKMSHSLFIYKELMQAIGEGHIGIKKTNTGYEAFIKKEV